MAQRTSTNAAVGLVGIGEMGAAVGRELVAAGFDVHACVDGRSDESVARAEEAALRAVDDLDALVAASEVLFSIVPSDVAEGVAGDVARSSRRQQRALTFVEANAISPVRVRRAAETFADTEVAFVDGGLVGAPPSGGKRPRLYLSGRDARRLDPLDGFAFDIVHLGESVGDASGFKMTYAAMTKGTNALLTAVLLGADRQGFLEPFLSEIHGSQRVLAGRAEANVSRLPADARRWSREMEEIRDTLEALGLPGGFHQGAADVMRLLADSRFGAETRRTRDRSRSMADTVRALTEDFARAGDSLAPESRR